MLHFTLKMGNDAYCIFRLYKPKIKSSSACKKRLDPEKYRRLWNYSETKHKNPYKKCEREKMQRKKNNNSSGTNSRNEKQKSKQKYRTENTTQKNGHVLYFFISTFFCFSFFPRHFFRLLDENICVRKKVYTHVVACTRLVLTYHLMV